ncbi:hypothetical protein [Nonomuraea salmonea]|uniref:Uncharacterized protein n=1 Tax=Nonomuraea salmonea TaxID=46181 RepID=A0ABV5P2U4_9ACTN
MTTTATLPAIPVGPHRDRSEIHPAARTSGQIGTILGIATRPDFDHALGNPADADTAARRRRAGSDPDVWFMWTSTTGRVHAALITPAGRIACEVDIT